MVMVPVADIADLLSRTLRASRIRDASVNGLQVRQRIRRDIRRVGFAVDACQTTFEHAKSRNVGMLVVHHGITWRPQKDRELAGRRKAWLRKQNIALYAAHLPLDLHETYGNNIGICRLLGVKKPYRFGRYHGLMIGYAGMFGSPRPLADVAKRLRSGIASECIVYPFGKKRVSSIGIVSGGGGDLLKEARDTGLDCFLVGEIDLAVFNAAREYGMSLIVGGHYATETVGVRSLMPLVHETFGIDTVFLDDPKEL